MHLHLRENLSFCFCSGRVVLLDLAADRYVCLGPSLESAFRRWAGSSGGVEGHGDFNLLRERGLLAPAPGRPPAARAAAVPPAARDLAADDRSVPLGLVVPVLAAELRASVWLRRRPLVEIVRWCRTTGGPAEQAFDQLQPRAERIAAAFRGSALILGAADRCLARAIAAMLVCRRRALYPTLVFGVRLNPFAAHCWVQLEDSVLVGDFEQVRLFTPILAVR